MSIHTEFLDSLTPSAIRAITARIRDKKRSGINIVNFAGGMPDEATFPVEAFAGLTAAILREEGGSALQYAASDGYDPLRQTVARLMERFRVTTDYQHILITCGSQQALSYLSRALLQPGDVVLCENPSYVGALDTFRTQKANVIGVDMDEDGMKPEHLEELLGQYHPRFIYCIPDFQNPTGRSMSQERRKRLVELAEQYDTYIVEDAPYSMISFNGQIAPAIKSYDFCDRVFYLGSFSKTICPGIRVGWVVADSETLRQLIYLKMRDDLQVSNLSQRQVDRFLRECDFDAHLDFIRRKYAARCSRMVQAVEESFPAGCRVVVPQGGIFLWLSLPEGLDAKEAFDVVFEENLAFVPGCFFYPDCSGENTMRLNFCTNDGNVIDREVRKMGRLLCAYAREKGRG